MGAGLYRPDQRSGAMHGRQFLVREVYYGTDGASVFLRLDFDTRPEEMAAGVELRMGFVQHADAEPATVVVQIGDGVANATPLNVEAAMRQVLEIAVPLDAIVADLGPRVLFQISLWQGGLPMGTLPHDGWLQVAVGEPAEWAG
jgi:hypothetical protein